LPLLSQHDMRTGRQATKPRMAARVSSSGYQPVGQTPDALASAPGAGPTPHLQHRAVKVFVGALIGCMLVCLGLRFASDARHGLEFLAARPGTGPAAAQGKPCSCSTSDPPQYFQTSPELWAGPTATGRAAFMAQTRTFDPTGIYVPNAPLQTSIPIEGMRSQNESIFKMMGSVHATLDRMPRAFD
jgi:hypothetical protein